MKTNNTFTFGDPETDSIQTSFRICVWNVHKCLSKRLKHDIDAVFREFDIILMQEAVIGEKWTQVWKNISTFGWDFFRSFSLSKDRETGVLTGSKFRQEILAILPTVDKEPILRTPKSTGLSLISIQGRDEKLLVVNTHAMNFNFGAPFLRQIRAIHEAIQHHEGPMIWAGDFNTWSKKRFIELEKITAQLGLTWLIPEDDRRFLKLDHILYRGVTPLSGKVAHDIKTSDHYPLFAEFEIV